MISTFDLDLNYFEIEVNQFKPRLGLSPFWALNFILFALEIAHKRCDNLKDSL